MKSRILVSALLIAMAFASEPTISASAEDPKVAALEEKLRALEQRVASLEAQLRERPPSAGVLAGKANWRKIQEGMSQSDVEGLLGSPTQIDAYGPFTVWNYGSAAGGSVQFDGKTKKVTSWHEPR